MDPPAETEAGPAGTESSDRDEAGWSCVGHWLCPGSDNRVQSSAGQMISLKLPAEDGGDWVNSLDLSAVNDCLDGSAEFPDNTGCAGLLVSGVQG